MASPVVYGGGYFEPLRELLDHAVAEGFVQQRHRSLLLHSTSADGLLAAFARHRAAATEHLIDRETS